MKLTPLDIRHKDFKRGMRGYADTEVDEFLDEIADEFERLFKENIDLLERCETLQDKIDQYRNLEETLQKTLVSAQRSAEELKTNAQKEAQLILSEAELKARQMVNESYADKQAIEKHIVVLKSSEEDFRFKFRSVLEGYLKQLSSLDSQSKKDGDVAGAAAADIKRAMAVDEASRAAASAPAPAPAAPAAASRPPAPPPPAPAADADVESPSQVIAEPDDLLADVESEVDDNEFKW
jgi:cell division initiation protein